MKYLLGMLAVLFIVLNVVFGPPKFTYVGNESIEIEYQSEGRTETAKARPAWKQNGMVVLGRFWFFPTTKEVVLRAPGEGLTWTTKPEFRDIVVAQYGTPSLPPTWRYFLASITLIMCSLCVFLFWLGSRFAGDRSQWHRALKEDSFIGFKKYMLSSHWPKVKKREAQERMKRRVSEYRQFYAAITAANPGPGRTVLLELLDSIEESGELEVGVRFQFGSSLKEHGERARDAIREIDERLAKQEALPAEVVSALQQMRLQKDSQLNWNVIPVRKHFREDKNKGRERIIARLIDRVFAKIFPERIVSFTLDKEGTAVSLEVTYDVSTTDSLYSQESEKNVSDEKKKFFTGIAFDWHFTMRKGAKILLSERLTSRPAAHFSVSGTAPGDIYKTMAMTAFVNFGKELLKFFGLGEADGQGERTRASSGQTHSELFRQFKSYLSEAGKDALDASVSNAAESFALAHSTDILEMAGAVNGELEQLVGIYVNGLAQGVDIGDLAGDVLGSLFDA